MSKVPQQVSAIAQRCQADVQQLQALQTGASAAELAVINTLLEANTGIAATMQRVENLLAPYSAGSSSQAVVSPKHQTAA
ncbi:MAG: hypothetical protein WAX89_02520 [Alphaproteobacteria bacterium]